MICADVLDRLDDYQDGLVSEAELQEMELHLAGCPGCRSAAARLEALVAAAARLPREMAPPSDLWPAIATRLAARGESAGVRTARRLLLHPTGLAAAAAVVLALASLVVRRAPAPPSGPAIVGTPAAAHGTADHVQAAEGDYIRATGQLMDAFNARRASLSPETQRAVDENLRVIDDALGQLRDALEKDPGNRQLTRMLASTHQKKLDLLLRLLKLSAQI